MTENARDLPQIYKEMEEKRRLILDSKAEWIQQNYLSSESDFKSKWQEGLKCKDCNNEDKAYKVTPDSPNAETIRRLLIMK